MRITLAGLLGLIAVSLTGCGIGGDASSPYFEQSAPQSQHVLATPSNGTAKPHVMIGVVAQPNKVLTPGVVGTSDLGAVCGSPKHNKVQLTIPQGQAEDDRYGLPVKVRLRYHFDYLVPLTLGGTTDVNNIWPVSIKGIGFFQKEQLNGILRDKVCSGQLDLATVQQQLEKNWYTLWLKYGS